MLRAACVRLSSVSNGATPLGRQGHRASPAAPATQGACTELEPRRAARKLKEGRAGARAASACVCRGGAAVVGSGTPLRLPGPSASVPSRRSRCSGSRELERETAGNECVMAGRLWSARVHLCGYRSRPHPSRLFARVSLKSGNRESRQEDLLRVQNAVPEENSNRTNSVQRAALCSWAQGGMPDALGVKDGCPRSRDSQVQATQDDR